MPRFTLVDGATFEGESLGVAHTRLPPTKARWTEIEVWAAGRTYVVEIRGHSALPGEETRARVHVAERPEEVYDLLADADGELNGLASRALEEAGRHDRRLAALL